MGKREVKVKNKLILKEKGEREGKKSSYYTPTPFSPREGGEGGNITAYKIFFE